MNGPDSHSAASHPIPALELGPHATLQLECTGPDLAKAKTSSANGDTQALTAILRIFSPAGRDSQAWRDRFAGIERQVYAEIEGLGQCIGIVIDESDGSAITTNGNAIAHRLAFTFSAVQISAIQAGADFGFGVDDDRMRVGARVKREALKQLLTCF